MSRMKKIRDWLIIALALIAAVVAVGLISGFSMWSFIVAYWVVLSYKNCIDILIKTQEEEQHDQD